MKRGFTSLGLVTSFIVLTFTSSWALPDSRDSVIIQSKIVDFHDGPPATLVRVWITNKDTLSNYNLALVEKSTSAVMTLSWPRTFTGVATPLISSLQSTRIFAGNRYNSVLPDTFILAGFYDPQNIATTALPPNSSRRAILDIKFDTVWSDTEPYGIVELDSALIQTAPTAKVSTSFVDLGGNTIRVNFKKGILTVQDICTQPPCYLRPLPIDINGDGIMTIGDAVVMMNCVFGYSGDWNQAFLTTDLVNLMNALFINDSYDRRTK